jgi:hypothetical protein
MRLWPGSLCAGEEPGLLRGAGRCWQRPSTKGNRGCLQGVGFVPCALAILTFDTTGASLRTGGRVSSGS